MGTNDAARKIAVFADAAFAARQSIMSLRLRKFIGSLALIVFSLLYYWFAISVALVRLPDVALAWHLLFYVVTVVVWFIPSALIIRWIGPGK